MSQHDAQDVTAWYSGCHSI